MKARVKGKVCKWNPQKSVFMDWIYIRWRKSVRKRYRHKRIYFGMGRWGGGEKGSEDHALGRPL